MKNKDSGKIAVRYARALIEATAQAELNSVGATLADLADAWKNMIELRTAILNPALPLNSREQILRDLAGQASTTGAEATTRMGNFLAILLQNGRIAALPEISREYQVHLAALKQALSVQITSAFEIADSEKQNLTEKLRKDCGQLTTVSWSTDPDLIGGLLVRAGDRVLDNTVRGSLEQLRASLLQ